MLTARLHHLHPRVVSALSPNDPVPRPFIALEHVPAREDSEEDLAVLRGQVARRVVPNGSLRADRASSAGRSSCGVEPRIDACANANAVASVA